MAKIDWRFVWGLITSHDFAKRVNTARKWEYILEDGTFKLRDLGLISGATLKSEWVHNFPLTRKSIFLARDIIKMNNMKMVTKRSKFWNLIRGYLLEYPRPTANDVYVRDHRAEADAAYQRSVCCLPYDCMHYEHETGSLEIWNKAEDVECYHIQVRELVEAPAQHKDVFNGDHVVGTETTYVGWTCPDCKHTQEQESWYEYYG